ncbi:MAG TPA: FtsH protease activity modulator HflK [Leucothrix sp.]|nr:FtsH protease activity modulator HflK [Leucothrix sp.]
MPWNEPGGGDKNPWGNKGKSTGNSKGKGTADIEDITRKMNEKIGGLFGNKKSGDKGSSGPSGTAFVLIGLGLFAAWLATGFYQVDSAQRGLEFRFGAYTETTKPGLHWHVPYPVESVELVDIDRSRTAEDRTHMLTKDENIVDIGVAAQYRIKSPEDYLFNVYLADYERNQSVGTLHQVMRSAVREIAGRNSMDSILKENRGSIAPETQKLMQEILDSYKSGLEVIKVNVTYAEAPQQVKDAFDDANRAREDKDKYVNQAVTYAKRIVPEAEGKASRLSETALAYKGRLISEAEGDASRFNQLVAEYKKAPAVTRKRLYLETMEEVYENTNKIMVDTKSGNNLMYLPLDKLSGGSGSSINTSSSSSSAFDPAVAASFERLRRQNQNVRSGGRDATREGR